MNLLSPPSDLTTSNNTHLISLIQNHAREQGYAVKTLRFKNDKAGEKNKIWLYCTREDKIRENVGQKKTHGISQTNDCPFLYILKHNQTKDMWNLRVKEAAHNHDPDK